MLPLKSSNLSKVQLLLLSDILIVPDFILFVIYLLFN